MQRINIHHRTKAAAVPRSAFRAPHRVAAKRRDRRGSVLLVVIGLLLLLMLVGFTFFTFSTTEHNSAEYYSESMKVYTIGPSDIYFDFALEQLIIGPTDNQQQSALWPGMHSLVPKMLGIFGSNTNGIPTPTDRHPFNGTGTNIITSTAGLPIVDNDFDGTADTGTWASRNLWIAWSPAATNPATSGTSLTRNNLYTNLPSIDAGYTYPDINSVFLTFVGYDAAGRRVVIPAFHRPQYLRSGTQPISDWYQNASTTARVMRPHPQHIVVDTTTGAPPSTSYSRFLSSAVTVGTRTIQPFPFAPDTNNNGTYGEQGVWSAYSGNTTVVTNLDYDVDNDKDGVFDGVWLDLDFPAQVLSDGRIYIPLFSYSVVEADGLVNLNLAGNLAGIANLGATPLQHPFGGQVVGVTQSISKSNQGISASEINPIWPLSADPQSATYLSPPNAMGNPTSELQQHRGFFELDNTNSSQYLIDRTEVANMELLFILWGRPKYDVTINGMGVEQFTVNDLIEGRWGDKSSLYAGATTSPKNVATFPRPGRSGVDDDGDQTTGISDTDAKLTGLTIPRYVHPLDFHGTGITLTNGSNGLQSNIIADPFSATSPVRWLQYTGGYMTGALYQTFVSGQLMINAQSNSLVDEGDEVIVDRAYKQQFGQYDQIYGPEELPGLHLAQSDYTKILGQSRLRQLASFNFSDNLQADKIRPRFTTESWDRRQHAFAYDASRSWEFNYPTGSPTSTSEFPPVGSTGTDPFRTELRAVIGTKMNNNNFAVSVFDRQLRRNINRHLTTANPFQPVNTNNPPIYRHLTPHPTSGLASTPIPGSTGGTPAPTSFSPQGSAGQQEYWARRDRQQMARDIYTLLYMLGSDDAFDPTQSNAINPMTMQRPIYQDWQLQEMAQFAVNYVDALDRDNVITYFEYDKDLSNGWNLDDNPFTVDSGTDRGVVNGVEAQSLTLSEAIVLKAVRDMLGNNTLTAYNEMDADRFFSFIELRNASPSAVNLANGAWRIRIERTIATDNRNLVFKRDGKSGSTLIAAGGQYTIGNMGRSDNNVDTFVDGTGTSVVRASDFRVDYDGDTTFNRIIPHPSAVPADTTPPANDQDVPSAASLDLVHNRDWNTNGTSNSGNNWILTDDQSPPSVVSVRGGLINSGNATDLVTIILQRRANLDRAAPLFNDTNQNNDNPWVEVDRFTGGSGTVRIRDFTVASGDSMVVVQGKLQNTVSTERGVPLSRASAADYPAMTALQANSIGLTVNSNNPAAGTRIWQPHFDRDFASIVELLSIPLYGSNEVTSYLAPNSNPLATEFTNAAYANGVGGLQPLVAQAKFLRPISTLGTAQFNNRWYRILELLEVPTRMHQQIETAYQTQLPRVPGLINLNGLRHQENLFALLDGYLGFDFNISMTDLKEGGRVWWTELLKARDGRDPMASAGYSTAVYLPGSPASRPFRDLSYSSLGTASIERTLLRHLPLDKEDMDGSGTLDPGEDLDGDGTLNGYLDPGGLGAAVTAIPRRLFENRTQADYGSNLVDYYVRHRMLQKVANHSTTRSNVFLVWITVGFFEAYQPDATNFPNVYQIGAEMTDQARRRGFFVVDRSLLEQGYNQQSGTFDYRKFVQYRKTIE